MSMDRCHKCDRLVDTDFDCDCYDNPEKKCTCAWCREEMPDTENTETAHTVAQAQRRHRQ